MTKDIESKKRGSSENGATVVEFAVIVPLLLFILFGILEFSFIFYQRHIIENAAREGMRLGVRANNYGEFTAVDPASCTDADKQNRYCAVVLAVGDYLSGLYRLNVPENDVDVLRIDTTVIPKSLRVTVEVENFFPQLLTGLIPGFSYNQETLSYSITGRYEDPDEYDDEE